MIPPFEEYFQAVWGYQAYPWQSRLAQLVSEGEWPDVLDLPTGAGKTAVLDIALYDLIRDGGKTRPRRIVLVVDRRVIVTQVAARAHRLRQRIEAGDGVLADVKRALREIVGKHGPLLECPVLRGGIVQRDDWARYPHVPLLAASTVDQIGSRLLFRGYGVSVSMQPIHAGLVGCDTLFLLDEVHLSRPFADTLRQLGDLRTAESPVPNRVHVVRLSATAGAREDPGELWLEVADEDRVHSGLAAILAAQKPASLEEIRVRVRDPEWRKREALAQRAAYLAREMVAEGRRAVGVVMNRVDTARRTWKALEGAAEFDCELITGRMRPLDQEAALHRITNRIMADRGDDSEARTLVLVATQCIEAGADYDFDGLVTECASLDALRQRFGRLDRRGRCARRLGHSARAVILGRSDTGSMSAPVYGEALRNTWSWLHDVSVGDQVDLGVDALAPLLVELGAGIGALLAPHRTAPVILPTYLDQWSQTNPRPHADPDISLFLHGIPREDERIVSDVQIVWRADLTRDALHRARDGGRDTARLDGLLERIAAVPPGSLEMVSLPVWAVRRWLSGGPSKGQEDDLADVEGVAHATEGYGEESELVLLWRGTEESDVRDARSVPPGSTIVVPAELGGLGEHGTFEPAANGERVPVPDLGDVAQLRQRGRGTLRIDGRVWPKLEELAERLGDPGRDVSIETAELATDMLDEVVSGGGDAGTPLASIRRALGRDPILRRLQDGGWVMSGRKRVNEGDAPGRDVGGGGADDESFLGGTATLVDHAAGVAELAVDFGRRVGLPERLLRTLRWAGMVHDAGKVDPRFQVLLHGGDEISARFGEPIAKSRVSWQDRPAQRHAQAVARYPKGQRHELVSLDMTERSRTLEGAVRADGGDWELLLHLVASHHGWCRPLAPPVVVPEELPDQVEWTVSGHELRGSTAHGRAALDSGISRRFFGLLRRYGWHELAFLEAILRLADHRRSEWEEAR